MAATRHIDNDIWKRSCGPGVPEYNGQAVWREQFPEDEPRREGMSGNTQGWNAGTKRGVHPPVANGTDAPLDQSFALFVEQVIAGIASVSAPAPQRAR